MKYLVKSGLYPIAVEAKSEEEAREVYETLRGLVKGANPVTVEQMPDELIFETVDS